MNPEILIGQQTVCLCVLMIMAAAIILDKSWEPSLELLLSASVLMIIATAFSFSCFLEGASYLLSFVNIAKGLSAVFGIVSAVETAGFFSAWKPSDKSGNRHVMILSVLAPFLVFSLAGFFTREAVLLLTGESLSLLTAWAFYQSNVQKNLKRQTEEIERQQALVFQWQMQPHFLFNTMSSIRELMVSNPALAAAGLDNLAGYLRKNLDALTLNRMIPFEQELTHIEQYVMLEKMNPSNLFEVVYDLQVIDFSLPALTVQPLVENAIRHGVRARGSEGMVFLTTEPHGEMIRIIVEDNGPGFSRDTTDEQKARISHGLENVRKRLETQCGGSLHIYSGGQGTRLVVLIPKGGIRS